MATHYTILNNGGICRKSIISQPVFDIGNKVGTKLKPRYRLPAKKDPAPPLGNFADIVYLKEQSFLHRIRDVCTLLVGA